MKTLDKWNYNKIYKQAVYDIKIIIKVSKNDINEYLTII